MLMSAIVNYGVDESMLIFLKKSYSNYNCTRILKVCATLELPRCIGRRFMLFFDFTDASVSAKIK